MPIVAPVPALAHVVTVVVSSMPPMRLVEVNLEVWQQETEMECGAPARVSPVMVPLIVVPINVVLRDRVVRVTKAVDMVFLLVIAVARRCRARNEERERGDDAGHREPREARRTKRKSGRVAGEHAAPPGE